MFSNKFILSNFCQKIYIFQGKNVYLFWSRLRDTQTNDSQGTKLKTYKMDNKLFFKTGQLSESSSKIWK